MISPLHKRDVELLLDELCHAYVTKRVNDAVDLFTANAAFVGTGSDEERFGRSEIHDQVQRDLAQAETIAMAYSDVWTEAIGKTALFFARVVLDATVDGQVVRMPMRLTGVALLDGARPRVAQAHFSLASARQAEGESFTRPQLVADAVDRFRSALESGNHSGLEHVYAQDALFDVNLPEWRFQRVGPSEIGHQLDDWHPVAPRIVEWARRSTDRGAIVELALWEGPEHGLYSRSIHELEVTGDLITGHTMYCTGDWDQEALARHRSAVTLISP